MSSSDQVPEDESSSNKEEPIPLPLGDWREYRASLISRQGSEEKGAGLPPWVAGPDQENLHLLQQQDRKLAQESIWAHPTQIPEPGGLILAAPGAAMKLGDPALAQLVIFLLEHGPNGSMGVILNRPSPWQVADWVDNRPRSQAGSGGGEDFQQNGLAQAFREAVVYLGAFFPPNRVARQGAVVLHGQKHLAGAEEIVPGIYRGGESAGASEILEGKLSATQFRFFLGSMRWGPGQLDAQVQAGVWVPAAASRVIVLKQCLGLPTPLWKEVLALMGGKYTQMARQPEY